MEKKNFKETASNIKVKAKNVWDKYKVQIIIGGAAVASTVAVVLLCKEDHAVDVTEFSLDGKEGDSERLGTLVLENNNDDMELGQLICEEIDLASTEAKIMEHFEAVNDLCNEKDIVYNLCGSFGGKLEDNYMGTMIFKDGTCIKDTM